MKKLVLVIALTLSLSSVVRAEVNRKNLVLIVLDSVTAGHLRHAEASASYTPTVDRLRKNSLSLPNFTATSSWTKPTVASILTGLMPLVHKVQTPRSILDEQYDLLPEILKRAGYVSLGVVSHTFLNEKSGYSQGFDKYYQVNNRGNTHRAVTSTLIADRAINWLEQVQGNKPFFMFLHFFDPHFNFIDHQEFNLADQYADKSQITSRMSMNAIMRRAKSFSSDDLKYIKLMHAEEIALVDQQIGRVVNMLEKLGQLKDTIIVFTADHGEEFLERGHIGHTRTLYQELVNVPFFVYDPELKQALTDREPRSQIDILPTVLDLLQLPTPAELPGVSFAGLLRGVKHVPVVPVLSEVAYRDNKGVMWFNKIAVRDGDWKFVLDRSSHAKELFDLSKDPGEKANLAANSPDQVNKYMQLLEVYANSVSRLKGEQDKKPEKSLDYDKEELEQLKTLGYL